MATDKRPQPTSEAWEGLSALVTRTTEERDDARSKLASTSRERDDLQAEVELLKGEVERLTSQMAEREKVSAAALADANAQISLLEQEAGAGNGQPVTWYSIAPHAQDDFRVLTLTTPGVPPRAEVGERCMDAPEAEERFRVEVASLFDQIGSTHL